jgi:hypothetical protein
MGEVGLAQADQVGGDGALRAVPGAWVPFERAGDGSGLACPYLGSYYGGGQRGWSLRRLTCIDAKMTSPYLIAPVISSKALLYRCAVSRVGCCGAGDCRRRPRTPWSSNALVQPMWWAREELTSDFFRVRSTEDFAIGIRDR